MILIDSVYVHNSGGKTLLEVLINSIDRVDLINYWFLFDSRFDGNNIKSIKAGRITILKASELLRRKFYKKNRDKFRSVFCFSSPLLRRIICWFLSISFSIVKVLFIIAPLNK